MSIYFPIRNVVRRFGRPSLPSRAVQALGLWLSLTTGCSNSSPTLIQQCADPPATPCPSGYECAWDNYCYLAGKAPGKPDAAALDGSTGNDARSADSSISSQNGDGAGGTAGKGGAPDAANVTGGSSEVGGIPGTAGVTGASSTGGVPATGGVTTGSSSTGGIVGTGGIPGTGGVTAGSSSTGGVPGTGA